MKNINSTTPGIMKLRNNTLYLKLNKSKYIKISNNIFTYDYFTDDLGYTHICYIDLKKRVFYAIWNNLTLVKKNLYKIISDRKNILNIKIYILKESFNIFIIESNKLNESKITHIYYDFINNILSDHIFNSLSFDSLSFYQSHFESHLLSLDLHKDRYDDNSKLSFVFNLKSKIWSSLNNFTINQTLINYCKSLIYK